MLDPSIFNKYKSKADFDQERQEFEARKRQQTMQEQLGNLQLQKAQAEASAPKMPFQGTGLEAQLINQKYLANIQSGMDQQQALQNATDTVLQSQVTTDSRGNVLTRQPIFGGSPSQINQMNPREAMGMPVRGQGIVPEAGQSRIDAPMMGQRADSGYISPTTQNVPLPADAGFIDVASQPDLPMDGLPQDLIDPTQIPQGLIPPPPNVSGLPPFTAQDAMMKYEEDVRKIKADYAKSQYERGLESKASYESYKPKADLMLSTINELIDNKGDLKEGVGAAIGGVAGLQGLQSSLMPISSNQRKFQPIIDQIGGQTFMEAYEGLKGGGQITEIESAKAEKALARLAQTQDEEDFANSLSDLRDVVLSGLERSSKKAGVSFQAPLATQGGWSIKRK